MDIVRDDDGYALVGHFGDRMGDVRSKLSGWHFAKEMLNRTELDILYHAEQLLYELDRLAGGYFQ